MEATNPQLVSSQRKDLITKALLGEAEAHRNEQPSVDTQPLKGEKEIVIDYGQSGSAMELAMMHLRESIPNGQRVRTEAAFAVMEITVAQTKIWLNAKGFNV